MNTNKMTTNNNSADIIILLDESGSMSGQVGTEAVQGLNEFIKEQKKIQGGGNAKISIYKFNNKVRPVMVNVLLSSVPEFDDGSKFESIDEEKDSQDPLNYHPCGMTSLYDAIGKAIHNKLKDVDNRNVSLVVITDGQDTSSTDYKRSAVKTLVEETKNNYGWKVFFVAKGLDAFDEATHVGVKDGTGYLVQDGQSLSAAMRVMSSDMSQFRSKSYMTSE